MGDTCQRQTDKVIAMADIFISYAREDRDRVIRIVKALRNALRRQHWSVWWDGEIGIGMEFSEQIEVEIRAARCVIVIWSISSVASDYVKIEAGEGRKRKILLPAMIETVKIPLEFGRLHTADLTDWRGRSSEACFKQLLAAITRLLETPKAVCIEKYDHTDFDAMVKVPAGYFKYQKDKAKIEKPYMIDVYPVTNSRFRKFIEAGGYTNLKLWSAEGQKWLKKSLAVEPKYWKAETWNQPLHPVVGVNFYEAEAYANWDDKRLPTEKEWERAARGIDIRKYPWGNEFDPGRCNTSESNIRSTTPVTHYANGMSLAGCYDMVGNVWEWCQDWSDNLESFKVVRGGSWEEDRDNALCTAREWYPPDLRYDAIGFRCVRTL
jgi:hypothetical protein